MGRKKTYPQVEETKPSQVEKWKWEFLRRNEEYKKDYRALRAKGNKLTPEKRLCKKWSSGWSKMYDPEKSYEEILGSEALLEKWKFKAGLGSSAVQEVEIFLRKDNIGLSAAFLERFRKPHHLLISIALNQVNSLPELKKKINNLLDRHWELRDKEIVGIEKTGEFFPGKKSFQIVKESRPKKRVYVEIDYDILIKVGDWKAEGLTNEKIARLLEQRKFKNPNNESDPEPNQESAVRNVSHLLKRYRTLVNGGYRNITIP